MDKKIEQKYIVVSTECSTNDAPMYNGAIINGAYATLDEARARVREVAEKWANWIGVEEEDWKPGYGSDPESSTKWNDYYFDSDCLTAWAAQDTGFNRVEIFYCDNGHWCSCNF